MSKLSIGIVGLPNVGKSTLFNALLGRQIADASNYPFCTIDPNIGVVEVPDPKLKILADIVGTNKIIPAIVEFVDIAGLVKGASQGEGLGNKFLTNIRTCDAICHVLRYFSDDKVIKEGQINPQSDFELICAELIIKDLESIDKFIDANKNNTVQAKNLAVAKLVKSKLESGVLAKDISLDDFGQTFLDSFFLLTAKPFFIIANIDEDGYKNIKSAQLNINDYPVVPVCAKVESDLSNFSPAERLDYLSSLGINKSGLEAVITTAYQTLGLQSFYTTAGVKEVRAWTIKQGFTAPQAAGAVHSDFQRGFIMAEIVSYSDFIKYKGWQSAKTAGLLRHQGKDYIMQPDDVVEFRFNVT